MARMKYDIDSNGCHLWCKARNNRGYGVVWHDGRLRLAHRVAWLLEHGRWPSDGMVLDHVCNVKACVNPAHLVETENWRNLRRAVTPGNAQVEARREGWRRANARRRSYSPTYEVARGGE